MTQSALYTSAALLIRLALFPLYYAFFFSFLSFFLCICQVGVELVPLLKEKPTGKPRKDPSTGYLMNHSLPSTDVTKIGDPKRYV